MLIDFLFRHGDSGAKGPGHIDKRGNQYVVQGRSRYSALVAAGLVYGGSTDNAGVPPGTAIGTGAGIVLHNPKQSPVKLEIVKVTVGYLSGTLGAGVIMHGLNSDVDAAIPTGTAIVVLNQLAGSMEADKGSHGLLFDAATLPASPSLLRPFCSLQASLASTAVAPWKIEEEPDDIILLPNTSWSLEGIAAGGSSPLVIYGVSWIETPKDEK